MPNFKTSLIDLTTGLNTLVVNSTCTSLAIEDTSNFDTNDQDGHARSDFSDYRKIVITTGDGRSIYTMCSIDGDDVDEVIGLPSASIDNFNFNFREDIDEDGLWNVVICNYPTWNNSVAYGINNIVFYDGLLYQAISATTIGANPDVTTAEWALYEPTAEEELLTPYCTCEKLAVMCISLLKCKEKLVHEAFCLISNDFCNDDMLCKNKTFLNATKFHLLQNAMIYSINRRAWTEVEDQFNLMKSICNCG
jgi:hypothetical protein